MKVIRTKRIKNRNTRTNRYRPQATGQQTAVRKPRTGRTFSRMLGWGGKAARVIWKAARITGGGALALILLASLSAGLVIGYYYLTHSQYFMVKKVILSGLKRVSREEILRRTQLDRSVNIMTLKLNRLAGSLKENPWIGRATITRKLPDTVIIQIEERKPRTLLSLGSRLYYMDESGLPFKKVDPLEAPELPIVTGFTPLDIQERQRFFRDDIEQVFDLLETLTMRNDQFRLANVSEIHFDEVRGLTLFTRRDNVQVKVGFGGYHTKFRRLGRTMAHLKIQGEGDDLIYFNLECSPRVIVRRAARS